MKRCLMAAFIKFTKHRGREAAGEDGESGRGRGDGGGERRKSRWPGLRILR